MNVANVCILVHSYLCFELQLQLTYFILTTLHSFIVWFVRNHQYVNKLGNCHSLLFKQSLIDLVPLLNKEVHIKIIQKLQFKF